jgi:hypothetical protein
VSRSRTRGGSPSCGRWTLCWGRSKGDALLLNRFGFFFDDHRAMADCRAPLHLLSLRLPRSGRPILPLLLAAARRPTFRLWAALEAPIECKDLLKERATVGSAAAAARARGIDENAARSAITFFLVRSVKLGRCAIGSIRLRLASAL